MLIERIFFRSYERKPWFAKCRVNNKTRKLKPSRIGYMLVKYIIKKFMLLLDSINPNKKRKLRKILITAKKCHKGPFFTIFVIGRHFSLFTFWHCLTTQTIPNVASWKISRTLHLSQSGFYEIHTKMSRCLYRMDYSSGVFTQTNTQFP